MAERKAFLLRMNPELLDAVQKWAEDELRSLNGQIEFLLRDNLARAGRLPKAPHPPTRTTPATPGDSDGIPRSGT